MTIDLVCPPPNRLSVLKDAINLSRNALGLFIMISPRLENDPGLDVKDRCPRRRARILRISIDSSEMRGTDRAVGGLEGRGKERP